jgi:hypothetical protein
VIGRRDKQAPTRAQHASHLLEQAKPVLDVLEQLAGPHHGELAVSERQRVCALQELQLWMAKPSPAQRLAGNIGTDRARSMGSQCRDEGPVAAAQIQHALTLLYMGEQEVAAEPKALRRGLLRNSLPDALEVRHEDPM